MTSCFLFAAGANPRRDRLGSLSNFMICFSNTFLFCLMRVLSTLIFDPFNRQEDQIEIPELIHQTAQSGLIGKPADQQSRAMFLRDNLDISQPISQGGFQNTLDPDAVGACVVSFFPVHVSAVPDSLE
jgi:hypothetical protein